MIKEGDVIYYKEDKKAVVVKILDEDTGSYYCLYHQNKEKFVVTEFQYSNNTWEMSKEPGRVVKPSEWPHYVRKL